MGLFGPKVDIFWSFLKMCPLDFSEILPIIYLFIYSLFNVDNDQYKCPIKIR